MSVNSVKTQLDALESALRSFEGIASAADAVLNSSSLKYLQEEAQRHNEMLRAAIGPIEEIRRAAGLNSAELFDRQFLEVQNLIGEIEKRFRRPTNSEVALLFDGLKQSGIYSMLDPERLSTLPEMLDSIGSPWLDTKYPLQSIAGIAGLDAIGQALKRGPNFSDQTSSLLRSRLGDWRSNVAWPAGADVDLLVRAKFYADVGFDRSLSMFSANAFNEGLSVFGIKNDLPSLVGPYFRREEIGDDCEEHGFERTNAAHALLLRFETRLRKFIHEEMIREYGEHWIKHQVHREIGEQWTKKQKKSAENGEIDAPLIAYADFSDYVRIITRKDNWERVFERVFLRAELVVESFQRLYPIRHCTMHARIITQDDELYLHVETKRILDAINRAGVSGRQ